ncbi:MAG: hypothetical protein JJE49_03615 [Peptostreptococcaceae bacterium]|nr:hypothetical protein [Peptostreptococcaceae bacterium]
MYELISMAPVIIAAIVLIFYLLILDRLNRIAYAAEVAAQYQESIDRKLSALVGQLVDPETKKTVFENYNSKPGYRKMRIG